MSASRSFAWRADSDARFAERQIERFAKETPGGDAQVEGELRDGSLLPLESIIPEPGFGFLTLKPHSRRKEEVGVPIAAIARIRLGPPEEHPPAA